MRKTLTLLLMLVANPVWAWETPLPMNGGFAYACDRVPSVDAGYGYVTISQERSDCYSRVTAVGEDCSGGSWYGFGMHAAFDVTSSTCDSITALFYYIHRAGTGRVVPLTPFATGRGQVVYRTPVLPELRSPGYLEITGYGQNVSYSVTRARVEWRDGTVGKGDETPSTWGALKGLWR